LGALLWLKETATTNNPAGRQRGWLFIIVTAGTTVVWVTNQYTQYFLVFLPLHAILTAYALIKLHELLPVRFRNATVSLITIISAAVLLWYPLTHTPFEPNELLRSQKHFTRKVLTEIPRDEPVAVYWNNCGGYMFNPHVGYYWVAMPAHSEFVERKWGEHPFKESFIQEMESRPINYVIGIEFWMTEGMSDEAMVYVRQNFTNDNCLWRRNPS
ncbi:MAG: hypothetical protein ACR2QW_00790, partial [bacterium]